MIVIVDYGMGNLGSILNMLKKAGAEAVIGATPDSIAAADKLILPGVGAFDAGMRNLQERGLREVLEQKVVQERTPLLGICLGMQLLSRRSEEGNLPGLGWLAADTVRFRFAEDSPLKIPHMGWNEPRPRGAATLFAPLAQDARFYFVHSYHVVCDDPGDVAAVADYGGEVVAAVESGNIFGVQFHPEKSHRFGLQLLQTFAELRSC